MPSATADESPQATSSHMMKTTKRGRPFLKDTLDLFATLIVSLRLTPHKQFFKTFPNSFTTDDAAANLASLKFSQSNRGPDPREPSRVVTTTTTTTFTMTRDMAKAMCQHFMDARLIENAADPGSNLFKDRGVYVLTPKGLHVLERFISKNGINSDHLQTVFQTQPICIKLLHLERRNVDDEIIVTQSVITALFRRFVGKAPNYPPNPMPTNPFDEYHERSKGVALQDVQDRQQALIGKGAMVTNRFCFAAVTALEWLCDFTSVVGREEAAEMAAHFVRFGLITLVSDKRKTNDSAIIFTVRGSAPGGNSPVSQHGEFRCTSKAIYRVTDEGRRMAHWDRLESPNTSSANLSDRQSVENGAEKDVVSASEAKIHRRISMAERLNASYEASERTGKGTKESNTDRLKYILEEPQLRSLFRDFLRQNFCEENLTFWLSVQDFRRRFNITSSASSQPSQRAQPRAPVGQNGTQEKHHSQLVQTACDIYNMFLARSSQCELNIDHALRNELLEYLGGLLTGVSGNAYHGRMEYEQAINFNATQLQNMIRLYERIQTHVFRLMATDSVPKFIKTSRFQAMRRGSDEDWDGVDLTAPPGLGQEEGRAYFSVSQKVGESSQFAPQPASTPSSP